MTKPKKKRNHVLRTSSVKLSNKKQTKLGRQLKRSKLESKERRRQKQKFKSQQQVSSNEENKLARSKPDQASDEEELSLDESDVEYFSTQGELSFVSTVKHNILDGSSARRRKRKHGNENEEDFEKLPRLFQEQEDEKLKMILPIKTKTGLVKRMIEKNEVIEDNNEEAEDMSTPECSEHIEDQSETELPPLSSVELYANRQSKLEARKRKIANYAFMVTENPEENMGRLKDLLSLLNERDTDVYMTVRKLVMVSLMEVFTDIIPGYRIRLRTDIEKQQRMKKDTEKLMAHEEDLLKYYKAYLEFLEKAAKGKDSEKSRDTLHITETAKKGLSAIAIKCLCEMLSRHPHFNYRNNIITVIVPYMNNKDGQVSDMVCSTVRQVFREDKAGEVTLEIVRCISRMVKVKEFKVQPKVLETFLSLKIKEVNYTDPVEKTNEKKKQNTNRKMSKRERKRNKHMVLLEKELQETKATEDKKKRLKLHTDTIQAVFLSYFRILKRAVDSPLLPTVLEGLAKYAHLISLDFFADLFSVFGDLIESGALSYRESLHCVQTAFTILTGQGTSLNIDPMMFYRHLYQKLFHVHAGITSTNVPIILDCLDVMVSKRKKQVSQQRILAFLKRLGTLTLLQTSSGAMGLLAAMRGIIQTYNYSDLLFDNDSTGSGVFLPELDDPEHCNAHNTALWELTYLQQHYHPTVRKYAGHVSQGAPTTGEGQTRPELRKAPVVLFRGMEEECENPFSGTIPEKVRASKGKVKSSKVCQDNFKTEMLDKLNAVPDTLQNCVSVKQTNMKKTQPVHPLKER